MFLKGESCKNLKTSEMPSQNFKYKNSSKSDHGKAFWKQGNVEKKKNENVANYIPKLPNAYQISSQTAYLIWMDKSYSLLHQ